MRQVFSSPRLENVERVAELLREQGIEVRVTNGRSYRGSRRGNFSYRESANEGPQPAVWVVKSDDQPQARQILREAGLLDSGRSPTRYLDVSTVTRGDDALDAVARRRAFRIRAGLMLGIAIALAFGLMAWHRAGAPTAAPATPAAHAAASADTAPAKPEYLAPTGAEARYVVATPSALAALLIDQELQAARDAKDVCVSVDGADPSQTVLAQLKAADGRSLAPQSACADAAGALAIAVRDYRTDGSGGGAIEVAVTRPGGEPADALRRLEVRRDDERWAIVGPAKP